MNSYDSGWPWWSMLPVMLLMVVLVVAVICRNRFDTADRFKRAGVAIEC